MAEWKKIIVSGSQAELAGVTGSFTGSFKGDGSGLTNLPAAAISSYTNSGDNRIITSVDSSTVNGEANLTFDGTLLTVTGNVSASGNLIIDGNSTLGNASGDSVTINAQTINVPNIAAGTDNTVVVYNGSSLVTDEIDPKVWDGNLVDKQGTPVQYQVAVFNDADTLAASSNFTFNNSTLSVTGTVDVSSAITGSNLMLDGTLADGAGETTVLVIDGTGNVKSDEIDSRVWGTTLIDGTLTSGRVPYASDANTVQDSTNLTFDGTTLTANAVTVTNDLSVGGNLTVTGTITELQVTNLNIEDQFILLNSGSGEPIDTGIIFGGVTDGTTGAALFYDSDSTRLSYTAASVSWNATTVTPSGYVAIAYDVDGASHTPDDKAGNIKIDGGNIFIYV